MKTTQLTVIEIPNRSDLIIGYSEGLFFVKIERFINEYSIDEMIEIYKQPRFFFEEAVHFLRNN